MKRLSIRWKLTLWYGGVLAVVLTAFGTAVFLVLRHNSLARIDRGLAEELADVRSEVERADDPATLRGWLDRRFARHEGFDFQITRPGGERFFVNPRLADKHLPVPPSDPSAAPRYENVELPDEEEWRVVSVRVSGPDGPLIVQVARSLGPYRHELGELLLALLLTGPAALLGAVGGGYFLARRALGPVDRMTRAANEITADRLDRRIDVANSDDELGQLARTLNGMFGRLERSFAEMRRFTADAAHELRTPLAVIHNEAEVALRLPRTADEYAGVLADVLEETDRLTRMADQLLFLSRQDAGLHPAPRKMVPVDALLEEVVGHMRMVAQAKGVTLSLDRPAPCVVSADAGQLRRVFYNLLDNAIKYTGPPGRVTVRSHVEGERLCVSVDDTGVGIPPEHLPRVFDRFYRVDPSRTGEGVGLGLSICESIVKGLGGDIRIDSTLGRGTTVVVEFPCETKSQPTEPVPPPGSRAVAEGGVL
jgi:heavy metal sensor kinase